MSNSPLRPPDPAKIESNQGAIDAGGPDAPKTDALRRRLLKAGGAIPVMISLQSGAAWAVSTCASQLARPEKTTVTATLSDSDNKAMIDSVTGIGSGQLTGVLNSYIGYNPFGTYGDDEIHSAEVLHLLVTNGSCWASYCDTNSSNIVGAQSGQVCNGS